MTQIIPAKQLAVHAAGLLPACESRLENCLIGDNFDVLPDQTLQKASASTYASRIVRHLPVELLRMPPGTRLFGARNYLLESAGALVAEQVPPAHILGDTSREDLVQRPSDNPIYIDRPCVMVSRFGVMVWGHWIGELLPRVLLTEWLFPGVHSYVLPMDVFNGSAPRGVFNSIFETLSQLGIPKSRMLAARYDRDYVFANLHCVTSVITESAFHPGFLKQIRSAYLPATQINEARRRIALLRTESPARNITNLSEVVAVLNKYNFEFVEVGKLPFYEQVNLFATAEVIVGVLASGLSGLFFAPDQQRVLSLGPEGFINKFFYSIMQSRNAIYYDLRGKITKLDPRAAHFSDFHVDASQLESGLCKLNIAPESGPAGKSVSVQTKDMLSGATNLLVAVTFYYRETRLRFLADVLLSFSQFQVNYLKVIVITDTVEPERLMKLQRLVNALSTTQRAFEVLSFPEVSQSTNKFLLTWAHKKLISDVFAAPDSDFTHFIYAEDDIQVSYENFLYFLKYRPLLAKHGLIPSFIRAEFNYEKNFFFFNDQLKPTPLQDNPSVTLDDQVFINMWWPYCAMFILDQELGREYINSSAFVMEKSEEVGSGWGFAERAAMGLCFVNIPKGFRFRHVVPVDQAKWMPATRCWVRHLPSNITNSPERILGKIAADETLIPPPR